MNSYEEIVSQSSQNAFLVGGIRGTAGFSSAKIGNTTQIYNGRQSTSFGSQNLVQIQPLTSVPSNLLESGGYIDYVVRSPAQFFVEDLTIEIKINNNGATPCVMPMSFFLADKIEVYAGTQLLGTEEGVANYLKTMLCTVPSQLEVIAPFFNVNPLTYVEKGTLLNGTTASYFLPVNQVLKNTVPSLINEELRIRIHYAKKSTYDATADISLVSTVLWLEGKVLHPTDYAVYAQNYLSGSFIHRFYESRIHRFPMNITPASELTAVLSSLNGNYIGFMVYVQASNATSVNLHTPLANVIDNMYFTDQTSKILFGGATNSKELLKYRASTEYAGSRLFAIKDFIPVSVSPSIWSDWLTGSISGCVYLKCQGEKLVINTESSFGAFFPAGLGTQNVTVMGIQASGWKLTQAGKLVAIR